MVAMWRMSWDWRNLDFGRREEKCRQQKMRDERQKDWAG